MGYSSFAYLCIAFVALYDQSYVFSHQLETQDNATVALHTETIRDLVLQFCPVKCKPDKILNQQEQQRMKNFCCIPCDCTTSCFATGTCCIDIQTEHTHDDPESSTGNVEEMCVSTAAGNIHAKSDIVDIDTYMLVQHCPSRVNHNIGYDVISKCLQPDENVIDEMEPVYSNKTGRNYRNVYCAICNEGSINTVQWQRHFTCDFFLLAMMLFPRTTNRNLNETLLQAIREQEGCMLQWIPTNGKARPCIDHDDVIAKCNDPKYYSSELDNLCREIYSPVKGFLGIYKNVFCLRCNEGEEVIDFSCRGTFTFEKPQIFSTILDFEPYIVKHDNQQEQNASECQRGMTFDYKLEKCISKACPISQVQVGDSCQPLMQKVKGLSLDYRFKLLYQTDGFTMSSLDNISTEVRHLVLHDESRTTCAEKMLGIETGEKQVTVRIQLTTVNDNKSYNTLYEDFQVVQEKVEQMNKLAAERTYTVKLDNSPFEPIWGNYISLAIYSDFVASFKCGVTVAMSNMQFCDTVLVRDYDILEDDVVLVDGYIPFSPGEYIPAYSDEPIQDMDVKSVYICYDLYVSRERESVYAKGENMANIAYTAHVGKPFSVLTFLLYIFFE